MNALFFIFAGLLIYSALSVILRRNPVVAVLHLVLAFASCAPLWLMLEAEFLAMSLILVYVGAVMVLFLFVIMMLESNLARLRQVFTGKTPVALALAAGLITLMLWTFTGAEPLADAERIRPQQIEGYSNTYELGWTLFERYVYPFELAGIVLLLAIVAAIYLNLRRRPDVRRQRPEQQIRASREERLRLVSVETAAPAEDAEPKQSSEEAPGK